MTWKDSNILEMTPPQIQDMIADCFEQAKKLINKALVTNDHIFHEKARNLITQVLRVDEKNADAVKFLNDIDMMKINPVAAIKYSETIEDPITRRKVAAAVWCHVPRDDKALEMFEELHRLQPEEPRHVFNKALIFTRLGQHQEALKHFGESFEMALKTNK